MEKNVELLEFFNQVQRGIKKFGITRVMNHLRKMEFENSSPNQKKVFDYVVVVTANYYEIPKSDILYSNKRGKVTTAKRMCFALIKKNIKVSQGEIGRYFDKSRQVINHALKNTPIDKYNYSNRNEVIFMKDFTEINKQVVKYRNGLE